MPRFYTILAGIFRFHQNFFKIYDFSVFSENPVTLSKFFKNLNIFRLFTIFMTFFRVLQIFFEIFQNFENIKIFSLLFPIFKRKSSDSNKISSKFTTRFFKIFQKISCYIFKIFQNFPEIHTDFVCFHHFPKNFHIFPKFLQNLLYDLQNFPKLDGKL